MKYRTIAGLTGLLAAAGLAMPAAARVAGETVERIAPDRVTVRWTADGGVDLYMADAPDAGIADARLLSRDDRDGRETVAAGTTARRYFLLRDRKDGAVARVAERVLPLEQGSNFRDIGGYPAAGGRRVRWGLIYRSGASAMLTPGDVAAVRRLGLRTIIDLRSNEERDLAPTKITGVPSRAVDYSMLALLAGMTPSNAATQNGAMLYRRLPTMLLPQMKLLFAALLGRQGAVEYNCSAGQDRTGFATAMILSALGTPRDVILQDYHLSTPSRRPRYEMPPIDPARHPHNPVARLFAAPGGQAQKAAPLMEADGKAFLAGAFEEIEARWGSPVAYLEKAVGLTPADFATLRDAYTETTAENGDRSENGVRGG